VPSPWSEISLIFGLASASLFFQEGLGDDGLGRMVNGDATALGGLERGFIVGKKRGELPA